MDFSSLFTSPRLVTALRVFCAISLFTIIILIVALRNPEEPKPDQTLGNQIRNLSINVNSKLASLKQEGDKITEKLKDMDKSIVEILTDKHKEMLQSEMLNVLKALDKLSNRVKKLILNGTVQESCPEDWSYYSLSCYYVSKVAKTWDESVKLCEDKKSHLVVINSEEEQHYAVAISKNQNTWIGLTEEDNVWKWIDGTSYINNPKFWTLRYPIKYGDERNCASISFTNFWRNYECTTKYRYICEMEM